MEEIEAFVAAPAVRKSTRRVGISPYGMDFQLRDVYGLDAGIPIKYAPFDRGLFEVRDVESGGGILRRIVAEGQQLVAVGVVNAESAVGSVPVPGALPCIQYFVFRECVYRGEGIIACRKPVFGAGKRVSVRQSVQFVEENRFGIDRRLNDGIRIERYSQQIPGFARPMSFVQEAPKPVARPVVR